MELKLARRRRRRYHSEVLIVPSGIETIERIGGIRLYVVLIVPSGIETCEKSNRAMEARGINCT